MRTQQARDEVTLVIASTLLRFVGVLAVGVAALTLAWVLVWDNLPWEPLLWVLQAAAVVVAGVYLYRNRRPG